MNTEEILVRLGVDSSKVSGQLDEVKEKVSHFGDHMQKALFRGLIMHPIIDAIKDQWHELTKWIAEKWYDAMYGISEFSTKLFDKNREFYRELNQDRWRREADAAAMAEKERQFRKIQAETASLYAGKDPNSVEGLADKVRAAKLEFEHAKDVVEQLESKMSSTLDIQDAENESAKTELDLAKAAFEFAKKVEETKRKAMEDQIRAQEKLNEKAAEETQIQQRLAEQKRRGYEEFQPSLSELKNSGWQDMWGRFHGGPLSGIAGNIENLGAQAHQAFINNDPNYAHRLIDARNQQYDRLANAGIVPQRAEKVAEAQIRMSEDIRAIKEGRARLWIRVPNMA